MRQCCLLAYLLTRLPFIRSWTNQPASQSPHQVTTEKRATKKSNAHICCHKSPASQPPFPVSTIIHPLYYSQITLCMSTCPDDITLKSVVTVLYCDATLKYHARPRNLILMTAPYLQMVRCRDGPLLYHSSFHHPLCSLDVRRASTFLHLLTVTQPVIKRHPLYSQLQTLPRDIAIVTE